MQFTDWGVLREEYDPLKIRRTILVELLAPNVAREMHEARGMLTWTYDETIAYLEGRFSDVMAYRRQKREIQDLKLRKDEPLTTYLSRYTARINIAHTIRRNMRSSDAKHLLIRISSQTKYSCGHKKVPTPFFIFVSTC